MRRALACPWFVPLLAAALAAQDGAVEPAGGALDGRVWRPLQRPEVPVVDGVGFVRTPVDAFVLARLQASGLAPAVEADRHTLLRRVTYDLTGLPPTAAEITAFVGDESPEAYERVVDRLLASPQYGVKWAQHWLDLVRYAETDGYERDHRKPEVWRYRDWVVDALNQDLPYGEFVARQLAGDERPDATVADRIATGFHRLGIWDDEPTDREQHRYDDLDGIADTTARAFLGVSMGCARCHDHKVDPLPQREYYAFLAFFENLTPYDLRARTVPRDGAEAAFAAAQQAYRQARDAAVVELRTRAGRRWDELTVLAQRERLEQAEASVVAAYSGDRGSSTQLLDERGERHGAIDGQVVQVEGRRGMALRFDGDDAVVLPRLVQDSFTVAFFVRSDRGGAGRRDDPRWFTGTGLVDGEVPGIVADWGIAWLDDGRIVAGVGDPETFVAAPGGHHDGAWHHVAFTRDASDGRIALYVDGALVDAAVGGLAPRSAPERIVVGRSQPGGSGFRGDLDELVFHRRALTAAEVAALALDGPGGLAAGTLLGDDPAVAALAALRRPELDTVDVLMATERGPRPPESFVRLRGDVHNRGPRVEPGFPAMLQAGLPAGAREPVVAPTAHSSGRRTALARWITDPRHPATWRVAANRLWQHHFGRGLVRTSNDFGRLGEAATHPELLDWLACELLARGQSLKAMHRLLVTSATYRMASDDRPDARAADPRNDLYWRFDRRRLTAEEVRDSILATTGALQLELGGPSVFPPIPAEVLATASKPEEAWGTATPEQAARRSLYVHVKRSLQEPLLAVFDRADTDASCPVRFATVQPTQALTMLNGDFAQAKAQAFAQRLAAAAADRTARLALGLALVTQRPPRPADLVRLERLADDLQREFGRSELEALQRCCLVLLNGNEFLFLD
ncbi:MAG: DUF1553 domain-containing protein [Planctomycetes bacterium]|nr:DUF1553 domain-containing protein [Planctomycetota bacterium]